MSGCACHNGHIHTGGPGGQKVPRCMGESGAGGHGVVHKQEVQPRAARRGGEGFAQVAQPFLAMQSGLWRGMAGAGEKVGAQGGLQDA